MKAAASIGRLSKTLKTTSDKLLGIQLQSEAVQTGCRMDSSKEEYAEQHEGSNLGSYE